MTEKDLVELRERLQEIFNEGNYDPEISHHEADRALLNAINDPEVTRLYDLRNQWYA